MVALSQRRLFNCFLLAVTFPTVVWIVTIVSLDHLVISEDEINRRVELQVQAILAAKYNFSLRGDNIGHRKADDRQLTSSNQIACNVPSGITYDSVKALELFPDFDYGPGCNQGSAKYAHFSEFNETSQILSANCKSAKWSSWNDLSPRPIKGKFPNLEDMTGLIRARTAEMVMLSCGRSYDIHIQNVFKPQYYQRAQSILKQNGEKRRPLNIMVLFMGSVSRAHFFRKLRMTSLYLKELNDNRKLGYKSFIFTGHNTLGDSIAGSMIPMIRGETLESFMKYPKVKLQDGKLTLDASWDIGGSFVWEDLQSTSGFVSLWGTEECIGWIDVNPPAVTAYPTDHVIQKVYCLGEKVSRYQAHSEERRCIAKRAAHFYLLDYARQFIKNYAEVPKFSFLHFTEGEEPTGGVISTMDQDLKAYLGKYLSMDENTVVFMVADHGMKFGEWRKSLEGAMEFRLPVLNMIIPRWFLDRYPEVAANLNDNQHALITNFDLYATIKHLAVYPDPPAKIPPWSQSILDQIKPERTCDDAKVPRQYCTCQVWENVNVKDEKQKKVLVRIALSTQKEINKRVFDFKFCKQLTVSNVHSGRRQILHQDEKDENKFNFNYAVKFSTEDGNEWETNANHKRGVPEDLENLSSREGYPIESYDGGHLTILYIKRLKTAATDATCAEAAKAEGAPVEFCVC